MSPERGIPASSASKPAFSPIETLMPKSASLSASGSSTNSFARSSPLCDLASSISGTLAAAVASTAARASRPPTRKNSQAACGAIRNAAK
jgi:hypothetical protein